MSSSLMPSLVHEMLLYLIQTIDMCLKINFYKMAIATILPFFGSNSFELQKHIIHYIL